jgi:hypothetical protein
MNWTGRSGHTGRRCSDKRREGAGACVAGGADGTGLRLAGPPLDPTCRAGLDHRVGTAAECSHRRRQPQACAWRPCFGSMHEAAMTKVQVVARLSRLARRLVTRPAAGRADQ